MVANKGMDCLEEGVFFLRCALSCFAAMIVPPMKWMMSIGWFCCWIIFFVCLRMECLRKRRRERLPRSEEGEEPVVK